MRDLDEDDVDQHLGLRLVEARDDRADVVVGLFIGDDDQAAGFQIARDHRLSNHRRVDVLAIGARAAATTATTTTGRLRRADVAGVAIGRWSRRAWTVLGLGECVAGAADKEGEGQDSQQTLAGKMRRH